MATTKKKQSKGTTAKKKTTPTKEKAKSSTTSTVEQPKETPKAKESEKQPVTKPAALSFSSRDKTKYQFNGNTYGKGKIVLAVVQEYATKNKKKKFADIQKAFPKELHSLFGVVATLNEAKNLSVKYERYFLKDGQVLKSADNVKYAVCNQWGVGNIGEFITHARKLGFTIKEVK